MGWRLHCCVAPSAHALMGAPNGRGMLTSTRVIATGPKPRARDHGKGLSPASLSPCRINNATLPDLTVSINASTRDTHVHISRCSRVNSIIAQHTIDYYHTVYILSFVQSPAKNNWLHRMCINVLSTRVQCTVSGVSQTGEMCDHLCCVLQTIMSCGRTGLFQKCGTCTKRYERCATIVIHGSGRLGTREELGVQRPYQ